MISLIRCENQRTVWVSFGEVPVSEKPITRTKYGDVCLVLYQQDSVTSDFGEDSFILTPDGIASWTGNIPDSLFLRDKCSS